MNRFSTQEGTPVGLEPIANMAPDNDNDVVLYDWDGEIIFYGDRWGAWAFIEARGLRSCDYEWSESLDYQGVGLVADEY